MFSVDLRTNMIISPYSINWLVFITETCVYCAVRAGYLYVNVVTPQVYIHIFQQGTIL